MFGWLNTPLSAAFISAVGGILATWFATRLRHRLSAAAAEHDIAVRGLGAQLQSWDTYTGRLQEQIAIKDGQLKELWEHNTKQDRALFECERNTVAFVADIERLKKQIETMTATVADQARRMTAQAERIRELELRTRDGLAEADG